MNIANEKEIQNTLQEMINGVLYLMDTGIPPEQIQSLMKATEEKCKTFGIVWPPSHFKGKEVPGFEGVTSFAHALAIGFGKIARGEAVPMLDELKNTMSPGFHGGSIPA